MKLLLLLLPVLLSCSRVLPTVRSEYQLLHVDEFLVSNAYVDPSEIKRSERGLEFDYRLILKNQMNFERELNLATATIMIGLRELPIKCHKFQGKDVKFVMKPEETVAIDCHISLLKGEGMFQVSDYKAIISIPLEKTHAKFAYLLRAEDFQ